MVHKGLDTEPQFFVDIRDLLHAGRKTAYRSVNTVMVKTYWQIGKRIVEQEQQGKARAEYGEQLIVALSRYLTDCFGKGFSIANLWNLKKFYLTFPSSEQFSLIGPHKMLDFVTAYKTTMDDLY
jgi:hypothetical protein